MTEYPTPWQKIIRAADRGTGLRLTAREIAQLGMDQAITDRANLDEIEEVPCSECGNKPSKHRHYRGTVVCPKAVSNG